MNKKNQFALIATAWGHKGSLEHLSNMGEGLYNRYCLGDDYSKSAKDFKEMSELCDQLKNGLYSEKVATVIKRDESPNHFALSLDIGKPECNTMPVIKELYCGLSETQTEFTNNEEAKTAFLEKLSDQFPSMQSDELVEALQGGSYSMITGYTLSLQLDNSEVMSTKEALQAVNKFNGTDAGLNVK